MHCKMTTAPLASDRSAGCNLIAQVWIPGTDQLSKSKIEAKILKLPGSLLIAIVSTHANNQIVNEFSLFALMRGSVAQFL